jgi:hypothetical protein
MAKNKVSSFGVIDNLDFGAPTINVQDVTQNEVHNVQHVHEETHDIQVEYGTTQGNRNGVKLKRINMAFSDANYDYITKESRRNGLSATAFVNKILDNNRNNNFKGAL